MIYLLVSVLLIAADQLVKFFVRATIPLGGHVPFIPHVLELTYVENTGAAFSFLSEHTWLLTLVSAAMTVVLLVLILKKVFRHPAGLTILAVVLAGAVGNLIDRALLGRVTDMFSTLFMNFAVFNVADICVVLGGISLAVYILFFYEKLEKKEPPHGDSPADC